MAAKGKISRLPHALREQVNQRLLDGETAARILAWLNPLPDAIRTWDTYFNGDPATPQNLSEYRAGEYRKWLSRRDRTEDLKTLQDFAVRLAESGGNLADGAATIIAGDILTALESAGNLVVTGGSDDAERDPLDGLAKMAKAVASLQQSSLAKERLALDKRKTTQKDETLQLAREKFEKQTVEKFLQYAQTPEAQAILNSGSKKSIQMAELRKLIFGSRP